MFRSTQWADPGGGDTRVINTPPSKADIYTGSAFQPQTVLGVRQTDAFDDRVEYMAGEDGDAIEQILHSLPADLASTGDGAVYGGNIFGGIQYADSTDLMPPDFSQTEGGQIKIEQHGAGSWYSTLRRWAGFPLTGIDDMSYASATNDIIGDTANDIAPLTIGVGVRRIMEAAMDLPSRFSGHPISTQEVRPWDTTLGAWPWSGDKDELERPVVSTPLFFGEPLEDGLPSPTGAAGAMWPNTGSLDPNPLTWRVAPSPWDTGQADGDGTYIDSGTYHDGW
jgi:hypothetical protein